MIIWVSGTFPGGPYADSIQPAYNQMWFVVEDDGSTGIPAVVYCDVYFNGTYYKTITATSPSSVSGSTSFWNIDISGICQEFMTTAIPDITDPSIITTFDGITWLDGAAMVFTRMRNSSVDPYGIISPGGIVPVQATVDSPAVAGDGYQTDTFMVVNAALQKTDKISLEPQIKNFRDSGVIIYIYSVDAAYRVYPLSYLRKGFIRPNDNGNLPIIACSGAFLGDPSLAVRLVILLVNKDGSSSLAAPTDPRAFVTMTENCIYYIPIGPLQLISLLPSLISSFSSPLLDYYRVVLMEDIGILITHWIYVSPKYYINRFDGSVPGIQPILPADINLMGPRPTPMHTRLYFQNYLGHFDQVNFVERQESHRTSSSPLERVVLTYNDTKTAQSQFRGNVRANDYSTVTGQFTEDQMPFIKQLQDTAKAYIEYNNPIDVDDVNTRLMLPIVITDAEIVSLQYEDRYEYRVSFKYFLSSEFKTTRR